VPKSTSPLLSLLSPPLCGSREKSLVVTFKDLALNSCLKFFFLGGLDRARCLVGSWRRRPALIFPTDLSHSVTSKRFGGNAFLKFDLMTLCPCDHMTLVFVSRSAEPLDDNKREPKSTCHSIVVTACCTLFSCSE
jgi:hypothetical protein